MSKICKECVHCRGRGDTNWRRCEVPVPQWIKWELARNNINAQDNADDCPVFSPVEDMFKPTTEYGDGYGLTQAEKDGLGI